MAAKPSSNLSLPRSLIIVFWLCMFGVVLILSIASDVSQQFSLLAQSFLHGHLNFLRPIGSYGQDPLLYKGKVYWGEGPLPAIFMMPFVAFSDLFHFFFYQGYIQWLFILLTAYFIYSLARGIGYRRQDSAIQTSGFVLGSTYIGVAAQSSSWLFAQVITTFLLFWSLFEFFGRKRWRLIGLICGMLLLTRITAAPIAFFFIIEYLRENRADKGRILGLYKILLPMVIAGLLICLYNYLRFGSPLNGGFQYQLLTQNAAESRAIGLFSIAHIPSNLYSLLLRGPLTVLKDNGSWTMVFPYIRSNPFGMSLFITSPYYLYLFTKKWKSYDHTMRVLLVPVALSLVLVLCFYGIGTNQLGYRYALDFLPELYVVFMLLYRKSNARLGNGMKVLLLGSGLFNFYLLWTFI